MDAGRKLDRHWLVRRTNTFLRAVINKTDSLAENAWHYLIQEQCLWGQRQQSTRLSFIHYAASYQSRRAAKHTARSNGNCWILFSISVYCRIVELFYKVRHLTSYVLILLVAVVILRKALATRWRWQDAVNTDWVLYILAKTLQHHNGTRRCRMYIYGQYNHSLQRLEGLTGSNTILGKNSIKAQQ